MGYSPWGLEESDVTKRLTLVYIYNGILFSYKKNEIILFAATWMGLEIIILKKSDRERQISYDIT